MKILSKIEINYFRSIYSLSLSNVSDVNVLVGGNDTGKSNILKALNLFFNNQTELSNSYKFYDDFSMTREKEARSAKGRGFIWIKLTFNNFLRWESLPDQFTIKKTWNRYLDQPETSYPKDYASALFARFLNKISFHYIPPVRGRDIFSHYLNILHDSLIEEEKEGIVAASSALLEAINTSTEELYASILEHLGVQSRVQVPTDMRYLFEALDFSTEFSGYDIPLQRRGDGIQGSHIPFILDFIGKHSRRHHIWAYEEPENSLELGRCFDLAERFKSDFSKKNQVFITTHSPAFYDLGGPRVRKWLVSPRKFEEASDVVTSAHPMEESVLADEMVGTAALIASRAKEVYRELKEIKEIRDELETRLSEYECPQLVVEGKSDQKILETAFEKVFPGGAKVFDIKSADGVTNVRQFVTAIATMGGLEGAPVIGLLDNDQAGRNQLIKLAKWDDVGESGFKARSGRGIVCCGVLPVPDEIQKIQNVAKGNVGCEFSVHLPIEFYFPSEVISEAIEEGILRVEPRQGRVGDSEVSLPFNVSEMLESKFPKNCRYFAYKVAASSKDRFSNWVVTKDPAAFEYFRPMFEALTYLIKELGYKSGDERTTEAAASS